MIATSTLGTRGSDPARIDAAPTAAVHEITCDPGCPFCLGPETD